MCDSHIRIKGIHYVSIQKQSLSVCVDVGFSAQLPSFCNFILISFRSLFHFHLHFVVHFNLFGSAIQCFRVCILYLKNRFHLQQSHSVDINKERPIRCALIQISNLLEISFIASSIEFTFLPSVKQFYHSVFMTTKKQDKKKWNQTSGREGERRIETQLMVCAEMDSQKRQQQQQQLQRRRRQNMRKEQVKKEPNDDSLSTLGSPQQPIFHSRTKHLDWIFRCCV